MEKRMLGIILTAMGIAGLVFAAVSYINHGFGQGQNARAVAMSGVLGLIFFFAGIGIVRTTRDIKKKNEDVV